MVELRDVFTFQPCSERLRITKDIRVGRQSNNKRGVWWDALAMEKASPTQSLRTRIVDSNHGDVKVAVSSLAGRVAPGCAWWCDKVVPCHVVRVDPVLRVNR